MQPEMRMEYSLADTWDLNQRVNRKLFDALTNEQLAYVADPRARSIADQFAHLHNARLLWLEHRAPTAFKLLKKIEKGEAERKTLADAMELSARAIGEMIAEAERSGKLKGWKRGLASFVGYVLAHEAHHRGQIVVHLKYARMPVPRDVAFELWEWEKL